MGAPRRFCKKNAGASDIELAPTWCNVVKLLSTGLTKWGPRKAALWLCGERRGSGVSAP